MQCWLLQGEDRQEKMQVQMPRQTPRQSARQEAMKLIELGFEYVLIGKEGVSLFRKIK
jgi:hypothetical protein